MSLFGLTVLIWQIVNGVNKDIDKKLCATQNNPQPVTLGLDNKYKLNDMLENAYQGDLTLAQLREIVNNINWD